MSNTIQELLATVENYNWTDPKITTQAEPKPGHVIKEDMEKAKQEALRLTASASEYNVAVSDDARYDMLRLLQKTGTYAVHEQKKSADAAQILDGAAQLWQIMKKDARDAGTTNRNLNIELKASIHNNLAYALTNVRPHEVPEDSPYRDGKENLVRATKLMDRTVAKLEKSGKANHITSWSFAKRIQGQIAFAEGKPVEGIDLQLAGIQELDTKIYNNLTEVARTYRRLAEEAMNLNDARKGQPGQDTWLAKAIVYSNHAKELWDESGKEVPPAYQEQFDKTTARIETALEGLDKAVQRKVETPSGPGTEILRRQQQKPPEKEQPGVWR